MYRENVSQQPVYDIAEKFSVNAYGGRKSTSGSLAGMSRIEQLKHGQAIGFDQNWNLPRISTVRANARSNGPGLVQNVRPTATGGN